VKNPNLEKNLNPDKTESEKTPNSTKQNQTPTQKKLNPAQKFRKYARHVILFV